MFSVFYLHHLFKKQKKCIIGIFLKKLKNKNYKLDRDRYLNQIRGLLQGVYFGAPHCREGLLTAQGLPHLGAGHLDSYPFFGPGGV